MTDQEIPYDPATNLPQLPEDHWWSVDEQHVSIMRKSAVTWSHNENRFYSEKERDAFISEGENRYNHYTFEEPYRTGFLLLKKRMIYSVTRSNSPVCVQTRKTPWDNDLQDNLYMTKALRDELTRLTWLDWRESEKIDEELAEVTGEYPPKKA